MKIDVVFSGGGVKAFAFMGALQSIENHRLTLERIAGTSAGAIVASLIAANYQTDEIKVMLEELDLKSFLDPPTLTTLLPFSKWFFLYFQLGINKGEKFERWLYEQLAAKNIYTFKDLQQDRLKVIVSDLSLGKLVVIPDDLKRVYGLEPNYFLVSKAIRMSAGFPYFFMPKKLPGKTNKKSIIVDGGLLSNFPLWVFENENGEKKRPILGVKLSDSTEKYQPRHIRNALDMFQALFTTMKQAHDARYITKSQQNNIIFIPVKNISPVDLSISDQDKQRLIHIGKQRADRFLKYWPS